MTEQEFLDALSIGEGTDWECKSARGGLPGSMWETYSAMANTDGGVIGLGIDEKDGRFWVSGLSDPGKTKKTFWDAINNRGKVSINLLSDAQVNVIEVEGDSVLVVEVPRAGRRERPVYVGQNPLDGTWVCNIFHFYERVVPRLTGDLKIPFQFTKPSGTATTTPPPEAMQRQDDTIVHEAVREALVNSLIHADHRGQRGIVVEKYRDRLEFSNPGTLLLDIRQILKGGVSECRNKTIQTMFSLLGYGERAESGFDKIRQGWASQQWRSPKVEETSRPDRIQVVLPMVSLLPEESIQRLQSRFGTKFKRLSPLEVQALVTADIEGGVSNARMQQITNEHPSDLTKMLQGLAVKRLLHQVGQKRGATYQLPGPSGLSYSTGDSSHKLESLTEEQRKPLKVIAAPAFMGSRLPVEETRKIILLLCDGNYFTAVELGELMNRNPNSLRNRFLTPLVEEGLLVRKFPDEPNRPDQAYTTAGKSG